MWTPVCAHLRPFMRTACIRQTNGKGQIACEREWKRENEDERTGRDLCSMSCSVDANWLVLFGTLVWNPRYSSHWSLRFSPRQPFNHGSNLVSAYRTEPPRPRVSALSLIRESGRIWFVQQNDQFLLRETLPFVPLSPCRSGSLRLFQRSPIVML